MADVWLDCPRTIEKFEAVLSGLHGESLDTLPVAIILQGPFLNPFSADHGDGRRPSAHLRLQMALGRLANVLLKFPSLVRRCKLFLQPALSDPLVARLEPRLPWSESLMAPLLHADITVQVLSHPSRLFFLGKELVILGTDLSRSLTKAQLVPPAQGSRISVFRTLLEQSHCCPLPLGVQARAWSLDHTLTLYPVPDYVRPILNPPINATHSPHPDHVVDRLGTKQIGSGSGNELCRFESGVLCYHGILLYTALPITGTL